MYDLKWIFTYNQYKCWYSTC